MEARPVPPRPDVRRRLATVLAFGASVVAIAATSSAYTRVDVPSIGGRLDLDPDHPVAMARVVAGIGAEAQAGGPMRDISLVVDSVDGRVPPALIVRAEVPGPDPSSAYPPKTPWQADVAAGQPVHLPVDCSGGPCERAFWLIGQLPAGADASAVLFHVGGSLGYGGDWPSGATASVRIEPQVRFAGAAPVLAVATPTETVHLDARAPVAARLLEVSIDAAGLHADGRPAAALTVAAPALATQAGTAPQVLLLDGPASRDPTIPRGSRPPTLQPGGDPFVGCTPGEPCTRHVMVIVGTSSAAVTVDWSATLRRADVVDAWSSPADLSAIVLRAWDVDRTAKPSRVHLEGDLAITAAQPRPQAGISLQTKTTSRDPWAPFLPVPASLTVRVTTTGEPQPSGEDTGYVSVTALQPDNTGGAGANLPFRDGRAVIEINPMLSGSSACLVGEHCPLVAIQVSGPFGATASAAERSDHWTLDAEVYPYAEVPLDLSGTTASVPLR